LLAFLGFSAPGKPRKAKVRTSRSQEKPTRTLAFLGFFAGRRAQGGAARRAIEIHKSKERPDASQGSRKDVRRKARRLSSIEQNKNTVKR
jgi:hypothetical protein